MRPHRALAAVAVMAVAAALQACTPVTPTAATVNGHRITQPDLNKELDAFASNKAFVTAYDSSQSQQGGTGMLDSNTAHPTFTQAFTDIVLRLDIRSELIHDELVRRHAVPPPTAVTDPATKTAAAAQFGNDQSGKSYFDGFNPYFQHLFELRQAEQDALGKALGSAPITDASIQQYYAANPANFLQAVCVTHISVASQQQAQSILDQLKAGATFKTLAAQSTDKTSTATGGDLGCIQAGQTAAPNAALGTLVQDANFVKAAATVPLNAPSGPLQSGGGWEVFEVTKRTIAPLTDPQVRQAIQQQLQQQQTSPVDAFVQKAITAAHVTVNSQYGTWDPKQGAVVAPKAPNPAKTGVPSPGAVTAPAGGGATSGGASSGGAGGASGASGP